MTTPVRLRLSRAKGFNLQEHSRATYCSRRGSKRWATR
jgi:hypothetical protein